MHVIEWAEFSLKAGVSEQQLLTAAAAMQQFLQTRHGYRARQLLWLGPGRYVDLVTWQSREAAQAAMASMAAAPVCRDYFAMVQVDQPPRVGTPLLTHDAGGDRGDDAIGGMEFSQFRVRPGVQDSALLSAASRMAAHLYQGEPGFHAHRLLRSDDEPGLYADVVLADTAEQARALCGKWGQAPFPPVCQAYLDLMVPESVQLAFWRRVG